MLVSEMLSFLRTFASLHDRSDQPICPLHAGTLASLLDACSNEAAAMEVKLYSPRGQQAAAHENVIHVNFNRPVPPSDGGDAA